MTTGIDLVAIYAAIVATIAVAWRVFEWFNDRAHLRLEVGYVAKLSLKPETQEDRLARDYLQLKVVNIGRRPITLRDTGIDGGLRVFNAECHKEGILPKRLDPGESLSIDYEWKRLQGTMPGLGIPKSLYIVDATDRVYSKEVPARIRQWLKAEREIEK